eukprot:153209-Pleurochrysis_carterae.AAC.4
MSAKNDLSYSNQVARTGSGVDTRPGWRQINPQVSLRPRAIPAKLIQGIPSQKALVMAVQMHLLAGAARSAQKINLGLAITEALIANGRRAVHWKLKREEARVRDRVVRVRPRHLLGVQGELRLSPRRGADGQPRVAPSEAEKCGALLGCEPADRAPKVANVPLAGRDAHAKLGVRAQLLDVDVGAAAGEQLQLAPSEE